MAAKPEASPAPAAPAAAAPAKGGIAAFLPLVIALVAAPAATFAVAEFVILPRLRAELATVAPAAVASAGTQVVPASLGHRSSKDVAPGAPAYEFSNVVVNLAGTMGTRYLKTSFLVTGADAGIKATFENNKPRLTDVTLNVLSSLTLADLEQPGARNIIREKLVLSYNQALGRKVADQVYFSDFVVQ